MEESANTESPAADEVVAPSVPPVSSAPEAATTPAAERPVAGLPRVGVGTGVAVGVAEAVLRAREAQLEWGDRPVSSRIRAMEKAKRALLARADEIAAVVAEECGKPAAEALLSEVTPNADLFAFWCDAIEEGLEEDEVALDPVAFPGKSGRIERIARGVVALITPWNFPVAIPLRTLVPALLAGNAVVWKPSEVTPKSGELVAQILAPFFPEGVLGLVQGDGAVGEELVRANVDLVVFTGSVATGRKIGAICGERLIPCGLELGGKDAAIVLADADLERAARGVVWGAFNNAGQNCASIERVYVESAIADAFKAKVVELTKAMETPRDMGRLTTLAQAKIVKRHVEQAVADGNEILVGGTASGEDPRAFAPTVVAITNEQTPLMVEETFGPVLPIVTVRDVDEALARANDSAYGLTTSLWTRPARGEMLAKKASSGVVTINNHGFTAAIPGAPWTGVRGSGTGVTNSLHVLAELTRPKFVLTDKSRGKSELWWYPYTPALRTIASSLAVVRGGGGAIDRVKAVGSLLRAFPKRLRGG
jgi:acyl-CoA reductase-like NAD-dependent aldehyde dehydrogenase